MQTDGVRLPWNARETYGDSRAVQGLAPTLRPYQVAALDRLDATVESGTRRVLLVASTGADKLVIAADKVKRLGAATASARFIPLALGWFVLGPVFVASIYASYRDVFYED